MNSPSTSPWDFKSPSTQWVSARERFERLYIPEPNTGCWIWIGVCEKKGYGHFKFAGRTLKAHRVSYEIYKGPIPHGLQIDHLCRVRCCVNPDHLEAVTCWENIRRGDTGKATAEVRKALTHCKRGHEYTEANTYRNKRGNRHCKACVRERGRGGELCVMISPWCEGDPSSKIALVPEAPGRTEMRGGRPLIGPAGKVLDECLHQAGIARRACYIINVFPVCVDKEGDGIYLNGDLLWSGRKSFTEEGMKLANETLTKLRECGANVVVPLGGVAADLLCNKKKIMKWRGSILWSEAVDKKSVLACHPAACLRGQYTLRYIIIADLKRARKESESPVYSPPDRNLMIDPTFSEAIDFMREMGDSKRIATDIEVLNHQVSCFSLTNSPDYAMCIPFIDEEGDHRWSEDQEAEVWLTYAGLLSDPGIMKINQNIVFDMAVLYQKNHIIFRGPIGDTMVAQHLMYPDFPKGLDFIASIHTREPYYKDEGKIWLKPHPDMREFWGYSCKDSAVALDAWGPLEIEMEEGEYRVTHDFTVAMYPSLVYMMSKGMKVDRERLDKTKVSISNKIKETGEALEQAAERPFNPLSPKQCQEYFYVTKGIKPYISRSTGNVTTDDKAMARIYRRYSLPEAKLVQEIRALKKLYGTYLDVRMDNDNRLRCSYNPRGTWTGRLSSSATVFGTGLNLQNLHPQFKSFLVAG